MDAVFATVDGTVAWSQGYAVLDKGEVWDTSAPLVRERPDLFTDEPPNQ